MSAVPGKRCWIARVVIGGSTMRLVEWYAPEECDEEEVARQIGRGFVAALLNGDDVNIDVMSTTVAPLAAFAENSRRYHIRLAIEVTT